MFTINGIESNGSETPLTISRTLTESVDWVKGYTAQGDFGGYEFIAIYNQMGQLEKTLDDCGFWEHY